MAEEGECALLVRDRDMDRILDDLCVTAAEDPDGFAADDGCPDPDNEGDGVPDAADGAPDQPETRKGADDDDGVPDEAPARLPEVTLALLAPPLAPGAARLDVGACAAVEALAVLLQALPRLRVELRGASGPLGAPTR